MQRNIAAITLGLLALTASVAAQEANQAPAATKTAPSSNAMSNEDLARLAKATANPLSQIWMLWNQTDTMQLKPKGESESKQLSVYQFQPVIAAPFNVGDDPWNFVVRPVFQYVDSPLNKDKDQLIGKSAAQIKADPNLAKIYQAPKFSGGTVARATPFC